MSSPETKLRLQTYSLLCSNQMQVAQGQGLIRVCPCASCNGCCILLLLVTKMVLTLCNMGWWCFSCHQLAQILYMHSWWSSPATHTGSVLAKPTNPFTDAHKHMNAHCNLH